MKKTDKNIIGERLRATRKSRHLTQKDISKELEIPQSNVSLYETGEQLPSIHFLIAYAQRYGIAINYLLGLFDYEDILDIRTLIDEQKLIPVSGNKLQLEIKDNSLCYIVEPIQERKKSEKN